MSTKLTNILSVEAERPDMEACRHIHLFREGSFLRAYEVSAWLVHRFLNDRYKMTNRRYKGHDEPVAMLGFPPQSLDGILSTERCSGFTRLEVSSEQVDVVVSEKELPDEYEVELFLDDFKRWKESLPVEEQEKSRKGGTDSLPGKTSATTILQKILTFPVENRTPLDCQSFLFQLRAETASLF